jgi:hypothetical protein
MTPSTKLQQISDVAWLVNGDDKHLGILNKDVQNHYTYITGKDVVEFNSEFEVVEHFGNVELFAEIETSNSPDKQEYYVNGYLVDYPDPYIIDEGHPDFDDKLPKYSKLSTSNVYYAAGYYCINFTKGWKYAHGPKIATLEKYGYEGPYQTELEARQRMKYLNKHG